MVMANTLAYYDMAKITAVKCFIVLAPGVCSIKMSAYHLHPGLIFAGKAGVYESGVCLRFNFKGRLPASTANIRLR
jgi:hypothetical protein